MHWYSDAPPSRLAERHMRRYRLRHGGCSGCSRQVRAIQEAYVPSAYMHAYCCGLWAAGISINIQSRFRCGSFHLWQFA